MPELYLIRHGKTCGNTLGRYIGTTDESLCERGREELAHFSYPRMARVFVSPMKRCRETAGILFPGCPQTVIPELRECDFGEFENRNYRELDGNERYQAWIDSGGTLPFPGGESREAFQERCLRGFREVLALLRDEVKQEDQEGFWKDREDKKNQKDQMDQKDQKDQEGFQESSRQKLYKGDFENKEVPDPVALVVHGGTIMSILDRFSVPHEDYYHWQTKNGEGFYCRYEENEKGEIRLYDIAHLGADSGLSA